MECAAKGSASTPCSPGPLTRRCGLCGAVAYCSPSHQMSHWNDHKEECARLEEQMRRAYILNEFPFTFSMDTKHQETRCSIFELKGLHQAGLWRSECGCGPSVVSSNKSWYEYCRLRSSGVASRVTGNWNLPSSLCPCTEPSSMVSTSMSSWKDYYQWRCLPFNSPVALLLHWPLTVYHSFQLYAAQSFNPEVRDKLNIHILGPDKELLQLSVFGELRALFPEVELHIELVGPAVPEYRDGETISLCHFTQCSEDGCPCKSSSTSESGTMGQNSRISTLTLNLRKGFYHDRFRDIAKDFYPQLIIAPNAGVAAYSSWLPTIKLIKDLGVPAIFTDYCEEAANRGAHCITSVTGDPLRVPIQVNPFRQPMVVENSALYLPCYSNCFIFGM